MEEQKIYTNYEKERRYRLFSLYCVTAIIACILGVYVIEYYVNKTFIINSLLKLILFYIVAAPYLLYRKKATYFQSHQSKYYIPAVVALIAIACALYVLTIIYLTLDYWLTPTLAFLIPQLILSSVRKNGITTEKQSGKILLSLFAIIIVSSLVTMSYSSKLHTSWRTPRGEETIALEVENIRNWNQATLGTWYQASNDDIAIVALQPKYATFADNDMYIWLIVPHEPTDDGTTYKLVPFDALEYFSSAPDTCVMNYRSDRRQDIQVKYCSNVFTTEGTIITVSMSYYFRSGVIDEYGNKFVSLFNEKDKLLLAAYWYPEGAKIPKTLTIGNFEDRIKVDVQHGRHSG